MKLPQLTLRDLFWLVLVAAMGCAAIVNTEDALRQLVALIAVIAVVCWFVVAI